MWRGRWLVLGGRRGGGVCWVMGLVLTEGGLASGSSLLPVVC